MSKDLVVVNGKQRKLRFNEVVLADGSVGKLKPGLAVTDLQLLEGSSSDELYRPVVPASVWRKVPEIWSRKSKIFTTSWFGSVGVVTLGASLGVGLPFGFVSGVGGALSCLLVGLTGFIAVGENLTGRFNYVEQERFGRSLQEADVSAFVAWVESRYGLVLNVDDYRFEDLAQLASLSDPSSHVTFTHETGVYRVRVTAKGAYLTSESVGELTQVGVASQGDSVKDLFPDEGKLLWVALQRRLKVLEGQDLVLEDAHVLRRVKQDAAELVSSLKKLNALDSGSDAELVVEILDGLNSEVQVLIGSQESAVLSGLRSQAEWVNSRKLVSEGSSALVLGSESVEQVEVAVAKSELEDVKKV